MTDREELDAVEAEHGALTNEYFELKEHFAGDDTPQWVVDRVEVITPRRDELFDLQWELRKKLNLDPRTGHPKVKAAPMETVDEGWFPELLGPICETSKCKHETDEKSIRTLDKAIVHECCDSCSYHLIRCIVDGKAVAGLSLRAGKPWRGKQSAVIDSVFTAPVARRQGYASKIMEYAREHFREVKHSKQLTTMGKAWKKAVRNPPSDATAVYAVNGAGARDGKYKFVTDCVGSTFEDIRDMIDRPDNFSISRETFRRRIGQVAWEDIQATLGYDRSMPISKDWHVSYGESVYRDVPCVFLKHSGIEHIYTLNGAVGPSKAEE